jgi:hypothetical protein
MRKSAGRRFGLLPVDCRRRFAYRANPRPDSVQTAFSNAGGERAAAIYSLLGSAKINGLDPEIYLQHVLERIADHPISRINELLPWNLALHSQRDHS